MAAKSGYMLPSSSNSSKLPHIKDPFAGKKSGGKKLGASTTVKPKLGASSTNQYYNAHPNQKPKKVQTTPAPQPKAKSTTPGKVNTAPPVSPFLTPDQQAAFNQIWNTYQGNTSDLGQQLGNAKISEANTVQQDAKTALQNTAAQENNAAARGLFTSSINDGALNDIAATKVYNDNIALSNLQALSSGIDSKLNLLSKGWQSDQSLYDWYAAQNAQNQTPVTKQPQTPQQAQVAQQALVQQVAQHPTDWRKLVNPALGPSTSGQKAKQNKKVAQSKAKGIKAASTNQFYNGKKVGAKQQKYGALTP